VLLEFFAVITSPRRVTNPLRAEKAIEKVKEYVESVSVQKIYDTETTLKTTVNLVEKYRPSQQNIFDENVLYLRDRFS
jgi:hypothetical protein